MNKNYLAKISFAGSIVFLAILWFHEFGYCRASEWCIGTTQDILVASPGYLSIFVATLTIVGASYLLRTGISRNLVFFTLVWVMASIVISFMLGNGGGNWVTSSPRPEGIFFFLTIIYAVIGLVWQMRRFLRH
ncbi:MAG: hypothetical protein NBV63_00475 [Candidatus Pacebacteria bacterium]|nr:hypothetical protein [Candidatus Paceibacterota bacterium]